MCYYKRHKSELLQHCNPRNLVIDFAISRKRAQMRTAVQYTQIFVIYANFEIFVYHIDIPHQSRASFNQINRKKS